MELKTFALRSPCESPCETSANRPAKTAEFAGEQGIMKPKTEHDIFLDHLKFENYDPNLSEEFINSYSEPEQLIYYKEVCSYLKKELSSGWQYYSEMYDDNVECGRTIVKLESANHGLKAELTESVKKYQDLLKKYNELTQKRGGDFSVFTPFITHTYHFVNHCICDA